MRTDRDIRPTSDGRPRPRDVFCPHNQIPKRTPLRLNSRLIDSRRFTSSVASLRATVQYVLLQSTFRTNRFGTNRQLVVFRIFDMFERQSLRSDRASAAFTQRRRHFSGEPIQGTFADTNLYATVNQRTHHIACECVGDDGEAKQSRLQGGRRYRSPMVVPSSISGCCGMRLQYAVLTSRMVVPPGLGVANEPKSCRPIVISAALFMAPMSRLSSICSTLFLVRGSISLDRSAMRYT